MDGPRRADHRAAVCRRRPDRRLADRREKPHRPGQRGDRHGPRAHPCDGTQARSGRHHDLLADNRRVVRCRFPVGAPGRCDLPRPHRTVEPLRGGHRLEDRRRRGRSVGQHGNGHRHRFRGGARPRRPAAIPHQRCRNVAGGSGEQLPGRHPDRLDQTRMEHGGEPLGHHRVQSRSRQGHLRGIHLRVPAADRRRTDPAAGVCRRQRRYDPGR